MSRPEVVTAVQPVEHRWPVSRASLMPLLPQNSDPTEIILMVAGVVVPVVAVLLLLWQAL